MKSERAPREKAPRRRTRDEQVEATTRKLLEAARRSFAEKGYAGTSMDELCSEVGLTRGALYHHFGGKEGLLEAVVIQMNLELNARLELAWGRPRDRWEAFCACCEAYLQMALEPEIQRVLFRDAPAVLGQKLREIDERTSLRPMLHALQELMSEQRIRPADPEALARLLNGALVDAALWIASSEAPKRTHREALGAFQALLEGLIRR
ncbi:MAG: TetR/AcrR family transcriptional regulator [Polyangiaceae bacterium]|nr:TetR/AcrR family transcriptional regulator [Polyangiaceae bacterium]